MMVVVMRVRGPASLVIFILLGRLEATFNSCLDRQVREGVLITYGEADEILNSKTEYHQPGVTRVVTTREVGR